MYNRNLKLKLARSDFCLHPSQSSPCMFISTVGPSTSSIDPSSTPEVPMAGTTGTTTCHPGTTTGVASSTTGTVRPTTRDVYSTIGNVCANPTITAQCMGAYSSIVTNTTVTAVDTIVNIVVRAKRVKVLVSSSIVTTSNTAVMGASIRLFAPRFTAIAITIRLLANTTIARLCFEDPR